MATNATWWKRSSIVGSGILAMAGLLISASPAPAENVWAQATGITAPSNAQADPNTSLVAVSCSSIGNCTATGSYSVSAGVTQATAATETSGTWAQAVEVTAPAGAGTSFPGASLRGVSCPSAGDCTAAGSYVDTLGDRHAMAAAQTSGSWAQATEITDPANARTGLPGAFLRGVSCSSVGNCTAVGGYVDSSGNNQAMTATETSGTWAQATEVTAPANAQANPIGSLGGVSCSSAGNCTATGGYADSSGNNQAMTATETSGVWAQATEVTAPANAQANPSASLNAVSCSSVGNCTATGTYIDNTPQPQAMVATEASGSWSQATELTAPADAGTSLPGTSLSGISCSSAGNCSAAGGYTDRSGNNQAMVATETSGIWAPATEIGAPADAAANPSASLGAISCSTVGNCTATGGYADSSGNAQAMAATEGPASEATPGATGYWLAASDGGIFNYGDAGFFGSAGSIHLNKPIVGMASTSDDGGYWLVASDGGIFNYGDAGFFGSAGSIHLNKPIVGMASTSDDGGYWLVASDGGIFNYGDAGFFGSAGSIHLNKPIVGMASTSDDGGYWLVASDGGIFSYGDATFAGSAGSLHLNQPIVGMASTSDDGGYWLVASDGGIFNYGDAGFFGSAGSIHLNKPIVGMAAPDDGGYWLVASDGGIFNYGDAGFFGSAGGRPLNKPIVGMSST